MKKPITLIQALRSSDFQYLSETTLRFVLLFVLVIGYSWAAQSQPYCTMVCNDNLNVSLGRNCEATITYDMILEDPDNSYHCLPNGRTAFVVQIMTTQEGVPIPTSPTVTSDYVGQTLYVKVKHWDTGNSCSSTIFIEDKQVPLLNCPDDVTLACTASTEPSSTGFAMATDCSDFSVTYEDEVRDLNCGNITSQINRTWKARDIYGNERSCVQRINIQRPNINAVSFPANRDNVSASAISCTDGDTTPSNTGTPLFNGQAVTNEGSCKFTVNYNDELISGCEGSFKILRRWIVIDHCTSLSREHTQLIKVEDDNAPQLVCPQSMTVGANGFECSASVILPEATVTDACSNTISVQTKTPAGTIDGNGGVISSLPAGTHSIIYEATDACGNVGSCELIVSVIDNVKPAMVCEDLIKVTLTNNGTATIAATVFDDGTRDNCCADVNFEVRRMDEPDTAFAPTITFDCADAATEVQVVLRGTDCNGNAGICMVMAEIEDKSGPAISCPATTTIYCTDDASDLDLTGEPTGFDACGLGAVSFSDETFLNDCNTGYILRTFTIDDDNSNAPASCVQRINIIDTATVSVVFPPDYTTSNCGSASDLQPDDLPEPFNRPTTAGEGCGLLAINFTDEVFTVAPPACFKILRTWTVINWCEYDPNNPNGPGRYEEIQVIKVLDNDAPTFDCPSALTFDITGADCTTTIELPALSNVDDCSGDINIQVSGDLGSGTTFTDVAPGTYAFTYTVSDGCGNAASCEVTATVRDTKPPTSYCNNGIVATLMPTGMVDVWAVDLNAGSFDNCTEQDDLQFRISASGGAPGDVPNTTALTFTCENLGTNAVRVWVGDQKGNWSFCETFVQVQDPNEACSGFTGGASIVAGLITNTYGEAIEGVEININGQGALAPTYTDVDGRFRFEHVEAGADYTISPNKRINSRNGVTTFDQVLIQKHILELEKLDSPYKIVAADVNRSGTITNADMVAIRSLILSRTTEFEDNDSWRFIDANYQFRSTDPLNENFPEVYSINDFSSDMHDVNFMAVKVGDVNDSAIPSDLSATDERNEVTVGTLPLYTTDRWITAGEEVIVNVSTKAWSKLVGYQFTIDFDETGLAFVEPMTADVAEINSANFGLGRATAGVIVTNFAKANAVTLEKDTDLFRLKFHALRTARLSELLRINSSVLAAEAYNDNLEQLDVQWTFDKNNTTEASFALYQNQPNPFSTQTSIEFQLPEAATATLSIYDISGQLVQMYSRDFVAGQHHFLIEQADLKRSGTFYYQLKTPTHTATRTMILLE